jgi:tRNA (guanine26-N2/guanine27-N2)-dimethyltransferase
MEIREGRVKLEVPEPQSYRAETGDYVPSRAEVFYNPHMEFCRDIGVAVACVASRELKGLRVCDPLAGVGVRGLRYALEAEGVEEVLVNDRSPKACEFVRRNLELNSPDIEVGVSQGDANVVLFENSRRFNFVDLDPFGSPAPFLDAACAALGRRGILALTATDTAPLCGTHPRACIRRYGAAPLRTEYCRELGIRILIGFAQRVAGKHELALKPVLVHSTRHYFRVYLRGEHRVTKVNEVLHRQGFVSHCFSCRRRWATAGLPVLRETCVCGARLQHAGPVWLGPLGEPSFIRGVAEVVLEKRFKLSFHELKLLSLCLGEAMGPPTYYEINELSRLLRKAPVGLGRLIKYLEAEKYFASLTHFSPSGFKTDAPYERVVAAFSGDF